jgi:hypothetical protein
MDKKTPESSLEQRAAVARMSAAAPDMYEALRRLVALIDSGEGVHTIRRGASLELARKALAKAKQ